MSTQSASIRLSSEHTGRKRREAVWIARYRVAGKDSAKIIGKAWTKRSRPPEGYLTRSQAEEALARVLIRESAAVKAASGATFDQVADAYLAGLEDRIRSGSFRASTPRTYRNIVERDLRPRWGDRPIANVASTDVSDYHAQLLAGDLAANTVDQTRAVVHGIFGLAVERFGLEHDASLAFKRAKTRRATSDRISFYPPDEVVRLVEAAGSEQDAALFLTAGFAGLRASELRALRWRSVDVGSSLSHVERGFTDEGGEDLPKSYRVRSVPMMPRSRAP